MLDTYGNLNPMRFKFSRTTPCWNATSLLYSISFYILFSYLWSIIVIWTIQKVRKALVLDCMLIISCSIVNSLASVFGLILAWIILLFSISVLYYYSATGSCLDHYINICHIKLLIFLHILIATSERMMMLENLIGQGKAGSTFINEKMKVYHSFMHIRTTWHIQSLLLFTVSWLYCDTHFHHNPISRTRIWTNVLILALGPWPDLTRSIDLQGCRMYGVLENWDHTSCFHIGN